MRLELQRGHRMFLGGAAVVLLGSCAGVYYAWKDCQELDTELESIQTSITAAEKKIATIDGLEREVIILRENVREYVRILPSSDQVNEFYRDLQAFMESTGIQIQHLAPGQGTRLSSFDRSEYRSSFQATYDQLLRFVSRVENHDRFVSIPSLKVKAGKRDPDFAGQVPVHDIDLELETYVYSGNEVGAVVKIPNYEQKKTALSEQIREARHELVLEGYQLLTDSTRRDPMVDPRMVVLPDMELDDEAVEQQRRWIGEIRGLLEECDAQFGLMEDAPTVMREMELRSESIALLTQIQERIQLLQTEGEIRDPNLRREFEGEILGQVNQMRLRLGEIAEEERPDENLTRLRAALAQMEDAFEVGDYEEVVDVHRMVLGVAAEGFSGPEVMQLRSRMDDLFVVATTALEFAEQQLEVGGLVEYATDEKERGFESVAVINGLVYREGEAVNEHLFLLEVHGDHLRFEYKGVPLNYDF